MFPLAFVMMFSVAFGLVLFAKRFGKHSVPENETPKRSRSRTRHTKANMHEISAKDALTVEAALEDAYGILFGEEIGEDEDLEEATERLRQLFDNALEILKQLHTD